MTTTERRPARGPAVRRWLGWQAATLGSLAALVVYIGLTAPRFFFAGDKQNQYLPAARDIGRRLRDGEWLPVIDPDLGRSGNFALDLQYGIFEPTHWVVAIALSYVDNLSVAALLWAAAFLAVLAAGVCALCMRLGVDGAWSAAVALGVATSGYVLFWAAPSWIPGLVSLAWVPWWWWCAVSPRTRAPAVVGSGVLTFLICGGGWPATWIIWGALVLGYLVEAVVHRAEPGRLRAALLHLLASAGGGVVALLTVLPLERAVDYTNRNTELTNHGAFVANLADLLTFASPGYESAMPGLGFPQKAPLFFGVWFVLVLLWLVPWQRIVLRRPGVVTAAVGLAVTALATQAPTNLGALRWPVRTLPGVPLFLGVGVAVAVAVLGLRFTKGRVLGIALSVAAIALLSWFRVPNRDHWLVPSLLLAAAAAVLLVVIRTAPRRAGTVALVTTVLMAGWAATVHADDGMADRGTPSHLGPGALDLTHEPTLVLYPHGNSTQWFPQGVASGFLRLTAEQRTQPGYSSIGQKGWDERFCTQSAHAYTCGNAAAQVNDVEPTTGLTWAELLGYRNIVVYRHDQHMVRWRRGVHLLTALGRPDPWVREKSTRDFVLYHRNPAPEAVGRITGVDGQAGVAAVDVNRESQTYRVSSAKGATLVFRDLYWPGYEATLDGKPLTVSALDDTLVTVTLPPGSRGTLELRYVAIRTPVWVSLVVLGSFLVLLAALLAHRPNLVRVRRRRSASAGS